MNVFITGATGFIGSRVCRILRERGIAVRALVRPGDRAAATPDAEPVAGELEDAGVLERCARDADAVLHLALAPGPDAAAIDRHAIEAFGRALRGSGKVFIHTSAAGIVGDTAGVTVDEAVPPHPLPLVRWRYENEMAALALAEDGLRVNVVRPAPIVHDAAHPGAVVSAMRAALQRDGIVPFVDTPSRWSTVHVEDTARLYADVLASAPASGIYFAASDEALSTRTLADAVGRGAALRALSVTDARPVFSFFAELAGIDILVSGTKARRDLGWRPAGATLLAELGVISAS